jgi:hypothetical protein
MLIYQRVLLDIEIIRNLLKCEDAMKTYLFIISHISTYSDRGKNRAPQY